jgi:hypothetical protein
LQFATLQSFSHLLVALFKEYVATHGVPEVSVQVPAPAVQDAEVQLASQTTH